MAKSLRWRLQLWHAAILTCAMVGFGVALYFQIRRATLGDIDAELLSGARVIDATLKPPPPPRFRPDIRARAPRGPADEPPRRDRAFAPPHALDAPRAFDDLGPVLESELLTHLDPPPFATPPPPAGAREALSSLPPSLLYRRGPDDPLPYFAVFGPRGEQIAGSYQDVFGPPIVPLREYEFRSRGRNRELWLRASGARIILVGRDIGRQLDAIHRLWIPIGLSGVGVLAVGLLGGWWLAGRAIEPLKQISRTASSITAHSLTQRIDVAKMDSELGELGAMLNAMLQRLEDSFDQQTRFVADASHELRTPISVLSMHCELALSRERSPAEYQRTLATCARASERMKSLVEDLLILARADAGQLIQRREAVDLALVVDESIALLLPLANEHQVTVDLKTSSAPCRGDSNHLLRLANNLISNAILYNRPHGSITVETYQDQVSDRAVLKVTDTGCGMSPEELKHLFQRFYRVDEARSRESGGSGLGLSICQSIATAHGGQLFVSSEKGIGTEAVFELPIGQECETQPITDPPEASFSR